MADLYKSFETRADLETKGIWFEIDDETAFLIARAGGANTAYRRELQVRGRLLMRRVSRGDPDPVAMDELGKHVFIDTLLKGWRGVRDKDGDEMEFTKGNAIKLFNDLPDLYEALSEAANMQANYREEYVEEMGESSGAIMPG